MPHMPDSDPADTAQRRRSWRLALPLLAVGAVLGAVVAGEVRGWPWLAAPLAREASQRLQRPVDLGTDPRAAQARIHLLWGLRLQTSRLRVGPRDTAQAGGPAEPDLLQADDLDLRLRWLDLWRAWRGGPLRIDGLSARSLSAHLARDAQGRGNWLPPQAAAPEAATRPSATRWPGVRVGRVQVDQADVHYDDALLNVHTRTLARANLTGTHAREAAAGTLAAGTLEADTTGRYRQFPLQATVRSTAVADWMVGGQGGVWPFALSARVGQARVRFEGRTDGLQPQADVLGRFEVSGPSLAAVGAPLGVVLPTTSSFTMTGRLHQQGTLSQVVVDAFHVGQSRLKGAFAFDRGHQPARLQGRLSGARLDLADLGPAIGVPASDDGRAEAGQTPRVLPQRPFNLPALSRMDANVVIDLRHFELHDGHIEALAPLRTHLTLQDGVLTLDDIDARTARGSLSGRVTLDGRVVAQARWQADLRWRDIVLQDWIPALAPAGRPPYLAGRMEGQAHVRGEGRSTAEILGSLDGEVQLRLRDGRISHLVVEAAGLDLAQGLGVLVSGDRDLPLSCARADVRAQGGVLRPRRFVLDTGDSLVRVMGDISLRDEHLALEAKVSPKDVSPLSLRTPIQVTGPLASPSVSVQAGHLLPRLAGAVALGFLNPVAAIVPLIDLGDAKVQNPDAAGCAAPAAS